MNLLLYNNVTYIICCDYIKQQIFSYIIRTFVFAKGGIATAMMLPYGLTEALASFDRTLSPQSSDAALRFSS